MRKRLLKGLLIFIGVVAVFLGIFFIYLFSVTRVDPPQAENLESLGWQRTQIDSGVFIIGNNWLRKSESGLYEMFVEGKPFERGVVIGKLTQELAHYQEDVFVNQLHQLVPSDFYINLLRGFIGWFNRDLDDNIPEESRLEIYGISTQASPNYEYIAPPYQRMINYHAAHDIGHALQNMSLVGCTSFAAWGERSADGDLIVARNFDFYVGDDFAKNKIAAFYKPEDGHKFMMITFGGMTGVLSGMNDQGLTVTINAAKSDIPSASATPVSLVAREILQYASTIQEAFSIASKRNMFVSESFLIGSSKDKRAAVIEKSLDATSLYESKNELLICTNHFQGEKLGNSELNQEHIRTSASMYRWQRVKELLPDSIKVSVPHAASVLRNKRGLNEKTIGFGNEKAINQLIAHHSVIFQPDELKVWVSTSPWQLGKYICYDLNKVFGTSMKKVHEIKDSTLTLAPDPFLSDKSYTDFVKFAKYRFPFQPRHDMMPDSLVKWNPDSYLAYMLAGDAAFKKNNFEQAIHFYEIGLTKEVATLQEIEYMQRQIAECKNRTQ
jgi:isopenicillin-N N-acyltransferase like protein